MKYTQQVSQIEYRKLAYRCRRGTLELETLMRGFLDDHYAVASDREQAVFCWLLKMEDDQLWDWLSLELSTNEPLADQKTYVAKKITDYLNTDNNRIF